MFFKKSVVIAKKYLDELEEYYNLNYSSRLIYIGTTFKAIKKDVLKIIDQCTDKNSTLSRLQSESPQNSLIVQTDISLFICEAVFRYFYLTMLNQPFYLNPIENPGGYSIDKRTTHALYRIFEDSVKKLVLNDYYTKKQGAYLLQEFERCAAGKGYFLAEEELKKQAEKVMDEIS